MSKPFKFNAGKISEESSKKKIEPSSSPLVQKQNQPGKVKKRLKTAPIPMKFAKMLKEPGKGETTEKSQEPETVALGRDAFLEQEESPQEIVARVKEKAKKSLEQDFIDKTMALGLEDFLGEEEGTLSGAPKMGAPIFDFDENRVYREDENVTKKHTFFGQANKDTANREFTEKITEDFNVTKRKIPFFHRAREEDTQMRKKSHYLPWSIIRTMLIKITEMIREQRPNLPLANYVRESLLKMEKELVLMQIKDDNYQMLVHMMREVITVKNVSLHPKTWERISFEEPYHTLLESPCKLFNFFFRFISLLLASLKGPLKREERIQVATIILQTLANKNFSCPLNPNQPCTLNAIFQYHRKYPLTRNNFCPVKR